MCLCVQTLVFLKLSSHHICTTVKASGVLIDILVVLSQELFHSCSRTCTSSNKLRFCVNTTEISKSVYIMLDEKVVFYRVFVFQINTKVMNSSF